jgi:tripartite-type tricarboxylate transporter receptor subunit TctC
MRITRRGGLKLAAAGAAFLPVLPVRAQATPFPTRPIRVLVPFAPGGATDTVARLLADAMRQTLGQPIIVENRPGASGILAMDLLARSAPDGHTLLVGNGSTNAVMPVLAPERYAFGYARSIAAVARLADIPIVLAATTVDFPPRTVAELIDFARRHPGRLNYASAGIGSGPHIEMATFARRAGVDIVHVPFPRGATAVVTEMLSGNIHIFTFALSNVLPLLREGRLSALAVLADARLSELPDVPMMSELGFADTGLRSWQALFAPAGAAPPVLEALHEAALRGLAAEPVRAGFARQGIRAIPSASLAEAQSWALGQLDLARRVVAEAQLPMAEEPRAGR